MDDNISYICSIIENIRACLLIRNDFDKVSSFLGKRNQEWKLIPSLE